MYVHMYVCKYKYILLHRSMDSLREESRRDLSRDIVAVFFI